MKKVLFVMNRLGKGGAERVATLIANELYKNKYEVKFISYAGTENTYKIDEGIKCEKLKIENSNKFIRKIKRIMLLRKEIKKYKPDIIIAFEYFINMQTILASLGLNVKVIISERNDPSKVGNRAGMRQLRNILYRNTDVLVCQTEQAKLFFPKKIRQKAVIIPNPIMRNLPKRCQGIRRKEIVTFCRIAKQKNLKMMVDAFEMLTVDYPDYKLVIYGEGPEKEKIEQYIQDKKLNDRITLKGFTQDVHKNIVNSSMYVSSSNYEGISNSMIEAMGIGLPTICTDCPCGGARMMIEDGVNGILIPVGDTEKLYQSMKKIIEKPEFAEKLSKNSIKINQRLDQNKITKMWLELIETKEK